MERVGVVDVESVLGYFDYEIKYIFFNIILWYCIIMYCLIFFYVILVFLGWLGKYLKLNWVFVIL